MCINLKPTGLPPGTDGRWFMVSGPNNFPGSINVGCASAGPFSLEVGFPSDTLHLGTVAGCSDLTDLWILPGQCTGTFHFKFVTPVGQNAGDCGGGDCEVACSDFILHVVETLSPLEDEVEVCAAGPPQNLFDLAGLSCNLFTVDYKVGSPEDADFDLSSSCASGNYGDFSPVDITPATYIFIFTPIHGVVCSDCQVELTVIVVDAPFTGYDCEETVCIIA